MCTDKRLRGTRYPRPSTYNYVKQRVLCSGDFLNALPEILFLRNTTVT